MWVPLILRPQPTCQTQPSQSTMLQEELMSEDSAPASDSINRYLDHRPSGLPAEIGQQSPLVIT